MENNEFSMEIPKVINNKKSWKREIIIGIIAIVLIIILIILLVTLNSSDDNENKNEDEKELAIINCNYKIEEESLETQIISESYKESPNFNIYIEGKKIDYTKKYKFSKANTYNIQYKLKGDINMDYMFKDINTLINIDMNYTENKKIKIKSMIGTFENCDNLNDFKIDGFDISEIKS